VNLRLHQQANSWSRGKEGEILFLKKGKKKVNLRTTKGKRNGSYLHMGRLKGDTKGAFPRFLTKKEEQRNLFAEGGLWCARGGPPGGETIPDREKVLLL